jgi:hypothetical protein
MFIGWSYTRFLFLALIGNPTWLPGPIIIHVNLWELLGGRSPVGSILKQTKRKHQLTIKTCIKYINKKSPAKNLQISSCSIATLSHVCNYKVQYNEDRML